MEAHVERESKLHTERPDERREGLDLLRAVSMMLVVTLHFLGKGGYLTPLTEGRMSAVSVLAWGLEALAIVAVNSYMLLSGYLLAQGSFKLGRLVGLWLQILFYSLGIGGAAALFGLVPEGGFSLHYLLELCLPVSGEHYWFMTAYFQMYLLAPLLSRGADALSKKQFQTLLFALLFVLSGVKSLVPGGFAADRAGYDGLWYVCVFLTAAYIRRYGIPFLKDKKRCAAVYLLAAAAIWGCAFLLRFVFLRTGLFEDRLSVSYDYNHILVLLASASFFGLFLRIKIKNGAFRRLVTGIAPYTLGVYLWHEHIALRYAWPEWAKRALGEPEGIGGMLALLVVSVLLIFWLGILADRARHLLFAGADRLLSRMGWYRRLRQRLDQAVIPKKASKTEGEELYE